MSAFNRHYINSKFKLAFIHGIIEADTTGGIFGPSGEGKTFISDDLMFSIVTGLPWNGHAVKKGLVLSCVGEGFSGKPRRLQASVVKYGDFDLSGLLISKSTLNFETDIQRIVDEVRAVINIKGLNLVLLVIDTFARHLMFVDENSAKDVMKFLKLVESLRSHFSGCSVLIITHTGNDSENLHRARGSSAQMAAMDFQYSCNKGVFKCIKMKDGAKPPDIEFKLEQVEIGIDEESGEMITSCVPVYGERSERNKSAEFTRIEAMAIAADSTGSAFTEAQIWVRAYLRADTALTHSNFFTVIDGILPEE